MARCGVVEAGLGGVGMSGGLVTPVGARGRRRVLHLFGEQMRWLLTRVRHGWRWHGVRAIRRPVGRLLVVAAVRRRGGAAGVRTSAVDLFSSFFTLPFPLNLPLALHLVQPAGGRECERIQRPGLFLSWCTGEGQRSRVLAVLLLLMLLRLLLLLLLHMRRRRTVGRVTRRGSVVTGRRAVVLVLRRVAVGRVHWYLSVRVARVTGRRVGVRLRKIAKRASSETTLRRRGGAPAAKECVKSPEDSRSPSSGKGFVVDEQVRAIQVPMRHVKRAEGQSVGSLDKIELKHERSRTGSRRRQEGSSLERESSGITKEENEATHLFCGTVGATGRLFDLGHLCPCWTGLR